jgi:hypothetical protein
MKVIEVASVMYQVLIKTSVLWAPVVIVCLVAATLEQFSQTENK